MNNLNNLLQRIEFLRRKMTEVALEKGFTSLESIYISQELDKLLNVYDYKVRLGNEEQNR
ncbi:Spo0E family sporulation regulatory protein-aspartic acid phosphatase [Aquibacillus halophilus]|uniref:Spo0E family sporulation regulatory protein-aspartic acid phosphatase n=1 Tax=Aquibacillus halophilus TaxID=930132 RepID=A0A6A8D7Y5_9BACI|nr:aspartyl-phosphate phosphatase Spo0E family protein [Aquibacillus halophilus]MRH41865.1 Spo0E family sporulation regulatory protein-aspartic acid phosphatase [Aquibacillus halophilus]